MLRSNKKVLMIVSRVNYPSTLSLADILNELVNELLIIGKFNKKYVIKSYKKNKIIIALPLSRSNFLNVILSHLYLIYFMFKIIKEIDIILFSQIIDYPLHIIILTKLLKKRIVDFIGGSRYILLRINFKLSRSFIMKLFYIYGIVSLMMELKLANKVVLVSKNLTNDFPFTRIKSKIRVAWNLPSKSFHDTFKLIKPYKERDLVIGYVGKISIVKGILNLIDAARIVSKENPNIKYLIIGNLEDYILKLNLHRKIANFKNNIQLLGYVPHNELVNYYNEMKLLILPSYTEGLPHVVLEAMACGTPVLTTRVGELCVIIKDGKTSFFLKKNNAIEIARIILTLISQQERLECVSNCAINWVKENLRFENAVSMWKYIIYE